MTFESAQRLSLSLAPSGLQGHPPVERYFEYPLIRHVGSIKPYNLFLAYPSLTQTKRALHRNAL
jgi:hypothetical protein